jgi:hypothetical protein
MTTSSPLASTDPDSIVLLFETDPSTLSDADLQTLVAELRRRRNAFVQEEAVKSSTARPRALKTSDPVIAEKLDKPVSELSLDDLT